MVDTNDDLMRKVDRVLKNDNTILESCREFLNVISPAVDKICNQVDMQIPNRNLVYRCIIKRAQENLEAIVGIASSEYPHMSIMPLRPLCEDLIYGSWLRTLPAEEGEQFIALSALDDLMKSVDAQNIFLPEAYQAYGRLPDGQMPEVHLPSFRPAQGSVSEVGESSEPRHRKELKDLGLKLGWPKGRKPSIYEMAKQADLSEIYEFFYHGSSKAVHASLHNMFRMVWSKPGGKFTISSTNFERYYVRFSLVYSIWLASEIFDRIAKQEFPEETRLINDHAYSVWLAIVVVGLARNGALPSLVTTEELRWRSGKADENLTWPGRSAPVEPTVEED